MSLECDCSIPVPRECKVSMMMSIKQIDCEKLHCIECGERLLPKQKYMFYCGLHLGKIIEAPTCMPCDSIRREYCPKGWFYGKLRKQIQACLGIDYLQDPKDWSF